MAVTYRGRPSGPGPGDAEALALADGEAVHAVVFGQHSAAGVDHRAAPHADAAPRNAWVSPDGMKQMSWLSGFSATARPRRGGLLADLRLGGVADREQRVAQLLGGQHAST